MRILVCGGRKYVDYFKMKDVLSKHFTGVGDTLIHGCADGADKLSEEVIYDLFPSLGSVPSIERYPADWKTYGKAAGPIRNKQMLEEGKPDLVIAFPGENGTRNMIKIATEAGVKVIEI